MKQTVDARKDAFIAGRDIYISPEHARGNLRSPGIKGPAINTDYDRNRAVFIQYLNPEILACYGWPPGKATYRQILTNALRATRLAVLATDGALAFPVSYVYEAPYFPAYLREVRPLVAQGFISYISPYRSITDYGDSKIAEYRTDTQNPYTADATRRIRESDLQWMPRMGKSTAGEITSAWREALLPSGTLHPLVTESSARWGIQLTAASKIYEAVPDKLDGRAFVGRFVENSIGNPVKHREMSLIDIFISGRYISSYLRDTDANMMYDFDFGDLSCGLTASDPAFGGRLHSARRLERVLVWLGIRDYVLQVADWGELTALRAFPEFSVVMFAVYGEQTLHTLSEAIVQAGGRGRLTTADSFDAARSAIEKVATQLVAS